jgi:hypothetical protein
MNRFDLLDSFIDNPKALTRRTRAKLKRVQSLSSELEVSTSLEDESSVIQSLTLEFEAKADKSLREFSTLETSYLSSSWC